MGTVSALKEAARLKESKHTLSSFWIESKFPDIHHQKTQYRLNNTVVYMCTCTPLISHRRTLSDCCPSREAAVGRWLISVLHTFLMRPLTFSTIGTIPPDCSASTHPSATRRQPCTKTHMHKEDSYGFAVVLVFPILLFTHTKPFLHTYCWEVQRGKEVLNER